MKILVTGGAGFIGSYIVENLKEAHHEIVIVDRNDSNRSYFEQKDVTYYTYDIHDTRLESIFIKEQPEAIIHLAAQISVTASMENPVNDMKVNGYGTIKLLQLATKYHVRKFIYASSAAVYGVPKYLPMDETHPVTPISFYGLSKAVGEQYMHLYQDIYELDFCILRFANVYGPGQSLHGEAGVISIFNHLMQNNLPLTIYGDGEQTRDFIFVKDIADACVRTLDLQGSHTINISTNTTCSLNELVQHFIQLFDYDAVIHYEPTKQGDIRHSILANTNASSLLDWQPNYTMEKGLVETYQQSIILS